MYLGAMKFLRNSLKIGQSLRTQAANPMNFTKTFILFEFMNPDEIYFGYMHFDIVKNLGKNRVEYTMHCLL